MSAVIREIGHTINQTHALPGNVFNFIIESGVLARIKHLAMMAHGNKTFSVKAYVGLEKDNRMHWLEETFYDADDVIIIAESLLNQHEKKNPFIKDDLFPIREEIKLFNFNDNPALSVLFPSS
jgi:hypothetical protein